MLDETATGKREIPHFFHTVPKQVGHKEREFLKILLVSDEKRAPFVVGSTIYTSTVMVIRLEKDSPRFLVP